MIATSAGRGLMIGIEFADGQRPTRSSRRASGAACSSLGRVTPRSGCRHRWSLDRDQAATALHSSTRPSTRSPAAAVAVDARSVETLTFDCRSPEAIARFWAAVLGYEVVEVDEDNVEIREPKATAGRSCSRWSRGEVGEEPPPPRPSPSTSTADEKARVLELGAREFRYVEKGASFWTVMLDPEGNEFCVLRGPEDGWSPE